MIKAIKRMFGVGGEIEVAKVKSWKQQLVEELQAWRPMGSTFQYCGRTVVVTGYWRYEPNPFGIDTYVGIEADYSDDLGVIHSIRFSAAESRALMRNQP